MVSFRVKVRVEVRSKVAWFSDPTPNLNPYNNLDLTLTFILTLTLGHPDSNRFPCVATWLHPHTIAVTVQKPET